MRRRSAPAGSHRRNMIIDGDTHLSPYHEYATNTSAEQMLRCMDAAHVDRALCWAHRPYSRNRLDEVERYVYEATQRHADRLIGYGWVDPMLGKAEANRMLEQCLYEYGFPGVKFNGCQNEHFCDDEEMVLPLLEKIAKAGASVAFHTGGDAPDQTHPLRVARIAKRFPEMKVLMVHIGCGGASYDLSRAAIEAAQACPNIWLVGSDIRSRALLNAVEKLGTERICFGSDAPFENMRVEVARYRAMFESSLPAQDYEKLMGGNLLRFLAK